MNNLSRSEDEDYMLNRVYTRGVDKILKSLEMLRAKPEFEDFAISSTQNFPPNVDQHLGIPMRTKSIVIFPKAGAVLTGAAFLINDQFYFAVPVGQTYPLVLRILPEWKFFTIPQTQDGGVTGQADIIFTSREYVKGTL